MDGSQKSIFNSLIYFCQNQRCSARRMASRRNEPRIVLRETKNARRERLGATKSEERSAKEKAATVVLMVYFYLQFVTVADLPMERLVDTCHFHPNLTEIFDANCSHSGFLDMLFLSCNICTGLFALPQTTFVVLNLYGTPSLSCVSTYIPWSKQCRSMTRTHRILVGLTRQVPLVVEASLYRYLPAWAASGSCRTRS
jgi:hypothetical protein